MSDTQKPGLVGRLISTIKPYLTTRNIIIGLIIGLPVAFFGGRTFLHLTSTPTFCQMCHEMKPMHKAWQKSTHAKRPNPHTGEKEIGCIDCHVKPGTINYLIAKVAAVKDGYYHIMIWDEKKMAEKIRHSATSQADACLLCHEKTLAQQTIVRGLRVKHHEPGDPLRSGTNCGKCHWKIAHAYEGESSMPTMEECFKCHDGTKAPKKCAACHVLQADNFAASFKGKLKIDCTGCHAEANKFKASIKACVSCHKGKESYGTLAASWQADITKLDKRADDALAKAEQVKADVSKEKEDVQKLKHDGSKGVHNYYGIYGRYAAAINAIEKKIAAADKGFKPSPVAAKTIACTDCHKDMASKSKQVNGKTFAHGKHIKGAACTSCHTPYEQHGKTTVTDCVSCHHKGATDKTCGKCHADAAAIYNGTIVPKGAASFKSADLNITCSGCHAPKDGVMKKGKELRAQCIACHKTDKIGATYDDWMKKDAAILKAVKASKLDAATKARIVKGRPVHNLDLLEGIVK